MPDVKCIACGRRVPWVSFWGNLLLGAYKVVVGLLGGSAALLADGVHSLSDVVGTAGVLISRWISGQPADLEHPYGHGKAEYMASVFVYAILVAVACTIFVGGLLVIVHGHGEPPSIVTLLAALVSVFYGWIMYLLGRCAGKENGSPALLANAFENRADAIASLAVVIGIGTALAVHPICDPIAAMMVGVVIFVNCLLRLKEAVAGLMDEALSGSMVERIRVLAARQVGVEAVDYVRTRETGTGTWVDLGIAIARSSTVAEATAIARAVRTVLLERTEMLQHVEVFVKPAR